MSHHHFVAVTVELLHINELSTNKFQTWNLYFS